MAELKKQDLELEAKKFFEAYKKDIGKSIREEENIIKLSFDSLVEFSPAISEKLLEAPEETLILLENSLDESGLVKNSRIRLNNLPESVEIQISKIKAFS